MQNKISVHQLAQHKEWPQQWQLHHLPALILGFFGGKKNIKFLFPADM
jgi:hypothetical protein